LALIGRDPSRPDCLQRFSGNPGSSRCFAYEAGRINPCFLSIATGPIAIAVRVPRNGCDERSKKPEVDMTKLDKVLKREIDIDGQAYIVTLSPEGLKLTQKGKRKGQEVTWKALVSGDAALASALNASVEDAAE